MTRDAVPIEDMRFAPWGSHNDGLDISSAQVLTIPTGSRKIMIQALTQNVRFTLDSTTPTASKGFQLYAGDPPLVIPIDPTTTFTVIEETATADLQIQFGR